MRKETDLSAVKNMALMFLHTEPKQLHGELGRIFVNHPVLEVRKIFLSNSDQLFDIYEEKNKYFIWLKQKGDSFKACSRVSEIFVMLRKPYRLVFFKYVYDYLASKDFATVLRESWICAENISDDVNVSMRELVSWFKKADKEYLMNNEERKLLSELPNGVLIYRGVGSEDYKYSMSWTLSFEKAKWFAERFGSGTQVVYKALVQKQDILAYFADRGENEVVVDPDALKKYNIEEVDI